MVSYCSIEVHQIFMGWLGVRSKYLNKTIKEKRKNYILVYLESAVLSLAYLYSKTFLNLS